ncbi:MAG TPA: 3'-5' exonuclease, partial [Parasegetibacter sp.]
MDKISKAMPENSSPAEIFIQRAGIMAEFGKIVCISTGFFYESPEGKLSLKIKTIAGDNEQEILTQFLDLINKFAERYPHFQFAGHNIK